MTYPEILDLMGQVEMAYIPATTGANTYVATLDGYEEYKVGQPVIVKFSNANTGASTLNINGLGAKSIVRNANTALISGEITANSTHTLIYGGTYFHMQTVGTLAQNASKLQTARNISVTLTGGVTGTGSTNFNGASNASINVPVTAAVVKSRQYGTVWWSGESETKTVYINSVDIYKSILVITGVSASATTALGWVGTCNVAIAGLSTNTSFLITLRPPTNSWVGESMQGSVNWVVIEFY